MYPLLNISNLSIDFITEEGITNAVKNIALTVNKGEIFAIVGESGSGKTVTSLSILQLLQSPPARYTSGEILFSGDGKMQTNLLTASQDHLRDIRGNQISMIFQEPMTSLNPVHTVGSQVMEAIMLHQKVNRVEAKKRTIALFEGVNLPEPASIINRYPHQLSGGQKQRVMIAMAMSCKPALLIADEPTTALDVTVQRTILELIKDLRHQYGMGVIYITHDLSLVAEIADRVVVMYKGEIVESGITENIFNNPTHPYTKALLACRAVLYPKGVRLPVVSDFMGEKDTVEKPTSPLKPLMGDENILTVDHLSVHFPTRKNLFGKTLQHFKAVDDVSFTVSRGETVGLVGESGCGKTTLGRTLLRLLEPTSGRILFKGKDIAHIPKEEMRRLRKNIQIIFQDPYGSLNPRMTIGNAIHEPMKIHGALLNNKQRKEKVIDLLEKVNLRPEHFNRYPHEFSGGQRQRICIARALGLNPEFIICDESVSALDVSVQAQVLNLLNDLKAEFGFTSIFISHDLSVVRYVSDRIIVMHKGRIVESGPAEEVYHHPKEEYTRKLIEAIPGK
jgi:peptide/nickel transport system ATP-binding protein